MSIEQTFEIPESDFFEVIVVGGGTCGLAVTARLCEDCPGSIYTEDEHQRFHWLKQRGNKVNLINRSVSSNKGYKPQRPEKLYKPRRKFEPLEILVLDGQLDLFMGQWDNQFAACQIPYLRSPMFFHPDPVNVDGMISYAHLEKRELSRDLMEIENVVGREYSKHQLKKLMKKNTARGKGNVGPVPNGASVHHDKPGIIDINMRDWKDYYRPSTPLFHDFCESIVDRYQLHDVVKKDEVTSIEYRHIQVLGANQEFGKGFVIRTETGKVFGCKICIVASGHRGEINYPIKPFTNAHYPEGSCHTTHLFEHKVNFLGKELRQKPRASKSRRIVIVGGGLTSAQLAHVAVGAGIEHIHLLFRGPTKIKHFDFHLDWVTKYKNVKKSAFYIKDTDEERFEMIQEAREGGSVNPEYYKKISQHAKDGKLDFLKYTTIKEQSWDDESKTWKLLLETKAPCKTDGEQIKLTELTGVDYIYFATGIKQNISALDFLQPIIKEYPAPIVAGFPCLTDDLQWNKQVPLFVLGKNASLKMGPSLANLDGARLGSERIGWYVHDLMAKGGLDWQNHRECTFCDEEHKLEAEAEAEAGTKYLDDKLDAESTLLADFEDSGDDEPSAFETLLKLASGQLNWYSLLSEA